LANQFTTWYNSLLEKEVKVEVEYKAYDGPAVNVSAQAPIIRMLFDGEKTPGEIGVIRDWQMDTVALAYRSWQSFTENDITQDVIKKFVLWVCGGGLKLQSEPLTTILEDIGITDFDHEKFTNIVEARFALFAKSQKASWSGEQSLNVMCQEAYKNALIGCDVLVVQRVQGGKQTVQLIDTAQLGTPSKYFMSSEKRIIKGVEIGSRGEIIGFHVKKPNTFDDYEFIKARDSKGRKMAYLVYATKMKIDDVRGIPIITPVLQTLEMLNRYKEATVGGAEERQKIAWFFEHSKDSDGENALTESIKKSFAPNGADTHSKDYLSEIQEAQGQIALTQQKSIINPPVGATIKSIQSDQEINFKDFFLTNINIICACIGIPPEIALSKYDSNFSASRAAIKDWEHTLNVARRNFSEQFYQPIYELWLDLNVLTGKIKEPNYLNALITQDDDVLGAYRNCRWTGASVPHIDPLKEVMAERAKLGDLGANIPLTTVERATENVNGGESNSNIEQFLKEMAKMPKEEKEKPKEKIAKEEN